MPSFLYVGEGRQMLSGCFGVLWGALGVLWGALASLCVFWNAFGMVLEFLNRFLWFWRTYCCLQRSAATRQAAAEARGEGDHNGTPDRPPLAANNLLAVTEISASLIYISLKIWS